VKWGAIALSSQQLAPRILESAAAEAERLDHHYVGTEHLLLGIPRERETAAGRVLIEKGLDIDAGPRGIRSIDYRRLLRVAG
jgi:hypothetical protein